ncbi:hypothetical protein MZM54_01720 [[Brevibacterium] frigoritolerans]|nr:hypothetical protein [Peribacillus frigoritolerans]
MLDLNDFLNSFKSVEVKSSIVSLNFNGNNHRIQMKSIRIFIEYQGKEYHFDKETCVDLSFDNICWHFNGGEYLHVNKTTGKKTKMLKIRLLNTFFTEYFQIEWQQAKVFESTLNSKLDELAKISH